MPSSRHGILDGTGWEDVKQSPSPESTVSEDWKPAKPVRRYTQIMKWIKWSFWSNSPHPPKKLRPTAYLDGLRGFAALLVYWHHHELWVHDMESAFGNGFGYEGNYYLISFHGIRHFFSGGHYAVSTFFIISGYVLSIQPLTLIQAGNYIKLGDVLAAALFKRWFRLYLPLVATLLLYATAWHAFGIWVRGTTQQSSLGDELWELYIEFKNFSFVFKEGGNPWLSYNFHLWSIPVELRGSIVIYTSLMAFSRCSRTARLWCETGLIYYFMYIADGWYCAMFVAGMLLCDLDLLAKRGELPRFLRRLEPGKDVIYYHLLLISLFLGGVPSENRDVNQLAKNRGWYYLSYLKPQAVFDYKWFYLFWASFFLVASVRHIHWLKKFFETRFCQFFGRISFGLYIIHGPVLWTLGDRLYFATGWQTEEQLQHIPQWSNKFSLPKAGPFGLEISFLVPHIILLPVTCCLAEITTRAIDTPSVKFAAWVYKKTLSSSPTMRAKE